MSHPHYCLVLGELQLIITAMRRNRKWKTGPLDYSSGVRQQNPLNLVHKFDRLRWSLQTSKNNSLIDALTLVTPFVTVISSPETSGQITALALSALHRFLHVTPPLFRPDHTTDQAAIHAIVLSLAHCRFESTDTSKDELVLLQLLSLVLSLLSCPASSLLDDADVWSMMKTCYRIYRYMRPPDYSELLCHQAEQTILQLVRTVCQKLKSRDHRNTTDPHINNTAGEVTNTATTSSTSTSLRVPSTSALPTEPSVSVPTSSPTPSPSYGYPSVLKLFEFICTLSEISHADVGFIYSLSQNLPVPPYFNKDTTPTSSVVAATAMPISPEPLSATNPHSQRTPPPSYFPSKRILLPSADLLDLGLLTLPPPPQTLPPTHFSSPTALSKALADWSRRTIFTTQLLLAALESALSSVTYYPALISLIEDGICKFLLRNCRSQHAMLYAITLRTFYLLMRVCRDKLTMQMEVMFNTVYLRMLVSKTSSSQSHAHHSTQHTNTALSLIDPSSTAYDLKELTLESLLDFCRLPHFFTELYVNYDCSPTATNLYENLFRSLCKSVFPVQGLITGNHVLAMKCLIEGIRGMRDRADEHISSLLSTHNLQVFPSPPYNPYVCLLSDLRATRLYKRQLQVCVDEFNKKPKRGIAAMNQTLGLFPSFERLKQQLIKKEDRSSITDDEWSEIEAMGKFLRTTPGLDKVIIGQYISEPGLLASLVLNAYVSWFDFHNQSLDDALRMFLESFRLPLEAQQIDRIMQAFAIQYHTHNPHLLHDADVVHTLSFSLIMLNTDAHNELIRNKMTIEQFVQNNRGINAGDNVPRALLEGLYHTIKKKEIRMSGDGLTGEVNDALWCDLLMMSKKVSEQRPYICVDEGLSERIQGFMRTERQDKPTSMVASTPQWINGHLIGMTVFSPPIHTAITSISPANSGTDRTTAASTASPAPSLPSSVLTSPATASKQRVLSDHASVENYGLQKPATGAQLHGLIEAPSLTVARQITLSELSKQVSLSTTEAQTLTPSPSAAAPPSNNITQSSLFHVTPPAAAAASLNLDEDMFLEGWNAAIAALSMVLDLLQVDSEGHNMVVDPGHLSDNEEQDERGWEKAEETINSTGQNASLHASLSDQPHSHTHNDTKQDTGVPPDEDSHLLNHLQEGFSLLADIAASFHKQSIVDKVISALSRFTGLLLDYRNDSSLSAAAASAAANGNVSNSSTSSATATPGPSLRMLSTQHRMQSNASLLRFSSQRKAQWSFSLMFLLVHKHADQVREGWREVVTCILQIYAIGLLPHSLLLLDDHVGWLAVDEERVKGRARLLSFGASLAPSSYVEEDKPSAVSALFSSVSSYLYGMSSTANVPETEGRSRSPELESAASKCAECVQRADIISLLCDSKMMQMDALKSFVTALLEVVSLRSISVMQWAPHTKKGKSAPVSVSTEAGEGLVSGGQTEGEGISLAVTGEDPAMISSDIYKDNRGEADGAAASSDDLYFPCAPGCVDFSSCADIPVEICRLLLCHQLMIEVALFNRDRIEQLWPSIRSHLWTVIQGSSLTPQQSSVSPSNKTGFVSPPFNRSSSIPVLSASKSTPMTPVSAPPARVGFHTPGSASTSALTLPFPLPALVVESAVVALFSLTPRLLYRDHLPAFDLATVLSVLTDVDLSHIGPASQLTAGLLSLLKMHAGLVHSQHVQTLLELLSNASLYHHTFMLGFQCLSLLILPPCITMSTFPLYVGALLHYVESRWCSAVVGLQCVQLLNQLYDSVKPLLQAYGHNGTERNGKQTKRESSSSTEPPTNGEMYTTPVKSRGSLQLVLASVDAAVLPALSPVLALKTLSPYAVSGSTAQSLQRLSSLHHLQILWDSLCLPFLSACRFLIISSSSRIRVIHAAHLHANRTGTVQSASQTSSSGQTPMYKGFIGYVQGFGLMRKQAIALIRHILVVDSFSDIVARSATQAALKADQPEQPESTPPAATSAALSVCSTAFWQLCLDALIFPVLFYLSTPHPIDLELTDDLTTSRAQAINILEKIFLLHLPQLFTISKDSGDHPVYTNANGSVPALGLGFTTRWLQVLKLLDVLLQLGVKRERLLIERKKKSVYDKKIERRRSSTDAQATDGHSPLISDEMDSGVLLTESVEEALKNLLLMMKATKAFGEHQTQTLQTQQQAQQQQQTASTQQLWELTWAIVDPVFPTMKASLFPGRDQQTSPGEQAAPQQQLAGEKVRTSTQPAGSLDGGVNAASADADIVKQAEAIVTS